ncbi:MAG: bifunctional heptose 7-phosphate kinase/heptose 1-phosphate adenyltransferase [Phycisphaerae bacterium]|nr:MAG: bifunctional heptose 7-phosphate kinase/heptose 1-phosphate adenyltransferase [Phycisphaerae bacterium]MBE7455221.1 bifunctional heptose 7-phosphate kinase/heptose 1-phosphate adenyltransferase [Planctomycetia bacterium]MCK6466422.1 bifunctional heptose 7-phosphate kinase/heptose 1-phosphate adenyltransferase [Phycisphaerae bacterium]MCL4720148.1 bifunctional heptose 7-phosphate kinase/heptose 1-phosphate adenyltransferase [Phycisphaerae bacterium]NUQ10536.1 bifunctional heptose 7-phosp
MSQELAHWVNAAAGRRILLVGDLILDRYIYGDAERISPEAPVPVLRVVQTQDTVGGAANVAGGLRALGCAVTCCGIVGDDRSGRLLRQFLDQLGVETSSLVTILGRPTTTKTRLVGLAQHRHRQQLLRVDEEETQPLSPADVERVLAAAVSRVRDVDAVCIEDYDKGLIQPEAIRGVIVEARRLGKPVLVDPAKIRDYSRYEGATIITPNRDELSRAVGRPLATAEQVGQAGQELIQRHGFAAVVATVDREGAVLIEAGKAPLPIPTRPRAVYDNTGAGDAVLSMLAAAVASGADLVSAVRLANVAGGLEVEKFGCVPISAEEILADLRLAGRRANGKLRNAEDLVAELALRRDRGETVAFTNGCFDILHAGHVDLLNRCRELASVVVVGVNTDESVRGLGKGNGDRPINRFADRCAVLAGLEAVDYVVGFNDPTPEALIRRIRPDVLVKGADWANKGVVGREYVESYQGRVELVPLVDGLSTTRIVERIRGGVPV